MHLETSSNFYGATTNPIITQLTLGGSSGGEGALLSLRGSCLGIGTDIGGSIRSPASTACAQPATASRSTTSPRPCWARSTSCR